MEGLGDRESLQEQGVAGSSVKWQSLWMARACFHLFPAQRLPHTDPQKVSVDAAAALTDVKGRMGVWPFQSWV